MTKITLTDGIALTLKPINKKRYASVYAKQQKTPDVVLGSDGRPNPTDPRNEENATKLSIKNSEEIAIFVLRHGVKSIEYPETFEDEKHTDADFIGELIEDDIIVSPKGQLAYYLYFNLSDDDLNKLLTAINQVSGLVSQEEVGN